MSVSVKLSCPQCPNIVTETIIDYLLISKPNKGHCDLDLQQIEIKIG